MLRILSLKDALRAGILLSLCLSLVGLSSCSDDDEDPGLAPAVSFKNLANNATVWNTVIAALDVNDDKGIEKVEIYVDGVLLQTIIAGPYEFAWNTENISEGNHTIRAVVTDVEGNESRADVVVVVKNILFSMNVPTWKLNEDQYGSIILTDDNGLVIASSEYHNGEMIELKSSIFNGEKFTVSEVLLDLSTTGYPITLATFPQVERGSSWVAGDPEEDPDGVEAVINYKNAAGNYRFVTNANNTTAVELSGDDYIDTEIISPSSKLYVVRYNDDPSLPGTYGIFQPIVNGNNAAIDLSQVNQPLSSVTANLPTGVATAEVILKGYPVNGLYSEEYAINSYESDGSTVRIDYPGTAFPGYYSETAYSTEEFRFLSGRTNEFYNFSAFSYDAEFSVVNNKLNYSASGNYDFATISWAGYVEEERVTRWVFFVPKGSAQSVAIPVLGETLTNLMAEHVFEGFDFAQVAPDFNGPHDGYFFHEYESFEGYDGLKTFISGSISGFNELVDKPMNYTSLEIKTEDAGGRVGAAQGKTEAKRRVSNGW